jgi:DNA primase
MPDDQIKERVRDSSDIVQVIGDRIQLKKAGSNYQARCPFHTEKTPSFNVNPQRQIYHCFGCGVGGDIFSFVMAYDKVSFPEALRSLAERAGIQLTDGYSRRQKATQEANDPYYHANSLARDFFAESLKESDAGRAAREYFDRRGLSDETIQKFGLGFAPDSWDGLISLARLHNIAPKTLADAGLVVQNDSGRMYDRFRNRVTFPITNDSGRVVAFGARTLDPDGQPKYLNSSESPVYQKNRILYGLYHARDPIRDEKSVLVVEGYMDAIRLVQEGIGNVVATCGTALTPEHGKILRRYTERIVIIFDGDTAGQRAALRGGDTLLEADIEALVALLPEGEDPDSYVAAEGPESLRELAANAKPFVRFKWDQLCVEHDLTTVTGKNNAISDMLDVISQMSDEMKRALVAAQVADLGGVDEALVLRSVNARRTKRRPRREPDKSDKPRARKRWSPPSAEKELVARMLDRPWVCEAVRNMGSASISDERAREIAQHLLDFVDAGEEPSVSSLLDTHPDDTEWSGDIAALSQIECNEDDLERAVQENIAAVQLPQVRGIMDMLRSKLRGDLSVDEQSDVLTELQNVTTEYHRLNAVFTHTEE